MIKAEVMEEAIETQKYIKHILSEFVYNPPLSKGEKIEISVIENKPPFPKIRESTDYYRDGKLTIPDADYNTERREHRTSAFIDFNNNRFKGLAKFLNSSEVVGNVLRGTLKFEVVNPEKIQAEYRKYELKFAEIDKTKNIEGQKDKSSQMTVLILDKEGNLYVKNNPQQRYSIKENSDRHKIVEFLADSRGYQNIKNVQEKCSAKTKQYVYNTIDGINKTARKFLPLDDDDLIVGKSGSGYKINPNFPISSM